MILLLLIAIDFGRAFLGWITLNNMARVGANYAAAHADAWQLGAAGQAERDQYAALIVTNASGINCDLVPSTPPPPSFSVTQNVGDPVTVNLKCNYHILTPFIQAVLGSTVSIGASSVFPITQGCIANCDAGPGSSATPPPVITPCRDVPDLTGLSVLGARNAWVAAGFDVANFSPATGSDTLTVTDQTITEPAGAASCPGQAFFGASVAVTTQTVAPPGAGCVLVPNILGMTVAQARSAWTSGGFTGSFTPATGQDTQIVISQTTTPSSQAGDCIAATSSIAVTYEAPPPAPPPAPCQVPSLVNTSSSTATNAWTAAGFTAGNLTFDKPKQLPYNIRTQSLVGGTYLSCSSLMTVSPTGNGQP